MLMSIHNNFSTKLEFDREVIVIQDVNINLMKNHNMNENNITQHNNSFNQSTAIN